MKAQNIQIIVFAFVLLGIMTSVRADKLILANNKKVQGELTLIGDKYLEFKVEEIPGEPEWIKVSKKDLLAVVSSAGRLLYPRDKYDENALNYGKVKIRNKQEAAIFLERKKENRQAELMMERKDKERFKVAALVGGLSGLMIWALLDNQ